MKQNPSRLLESLLQPPQISRGSRAVLLGLGIGLIGAADLLTGTDVSMGIFYLIPILFATSWFGPWVGTALIFVSTSLRLGADAYLLLPDRIPLSTLWNATAGLVLFLFVVWLLNSLLTLQRHLEHKVEERTLELRDAIADRRRLELEVFESAVRERDAFGRELHDDLGQRLVAASMAAQVLVRNLGDRREATAAHKIVDSIEDLIARTRTLARGMLLARIEPEELAPALEELAAGASTGDIKCRLVHGGLGIQATAIQCAQLYRIAQEAIGNALRHARATSINITLASDPHAVCLAVEDDGQGFRAQPREPGVGLGSMHYRASLIGATLSILSNDRNGTRIICRLPRAGGKEG